MTDTSPAAIRAWCAKKVDALDAAACDDPAAADTPATAHDEEMFRAVAALADLAAGGDVQREEDAALCERRSAEAREHAEHSSRPSVAALYMQDVDLNDRLARYARSGGGWRTMDRAPPWKVDNEAGAAYLDLLPKGFGRHERTIVANKDINLDVDTSGRLMGIEVLDLRLLPAPPQENDDGR